MSTKKEDEEKINKEIEETSGKRLEVVGHKAEAPPSPAKFRAVEMLSDESMSIPMWKEAFREALKFANISHELRLLLNAEKDKN